MTGDLPWPLQRLRAELDGKATLAAFAQALPTLQRLYSAPRDQQTLAAWARERLPAGRYVIYGAGTMGATLCQAVSDRSDVEIQGFLDRRAQDIGEFCGRPVLPPEAASAQVVDGILVLHHHRGQSIAAALHQLGCAPSHIRDVLADPDYVAFALAQHMPEIRSWQGRGIEHLVVSCAEPQWSLLRDCELDALPRDKTLHVWFGRPESPQAGRLDDHFPLFDAHLSLTLLDALIRSLPLRSVYVRVSAHFAGQFLSGWLKLRHPDIVVVQEMYDQTLMLTDEKLMRAYDCDAEDIYLARLSELASLELCDLVLVKNGGLLWEDACHGLGAPQCLIYPRVDLPLPVAGTPDPEAIIFAGTLPIPSTVDQESDHLDMRYVEMIQRLPADSGLRIDLFNAAHRLPGHDALFAPYHALAGAGQLLRYHPGLPFDRMIQRLPDYGWGWHIMHGDEADAEPVSRVGIGNKFTTYLACGLPVLIDPQFQFMADLVRAYGAGLVVAPADLPTLPQRLGAVDREHLRLGGQRLIAMMRAVNATSRGHVMTLLAGG
ncbi:MAG: hypothetical protein PW843_00485 [Azospirillaceae bacterium]|nr:hypothetical protein [Azospirillaceae bacterium]